MVSDERDKCLVSQGLGIDEVESFDVQLNMCMRLPIGLYFIPFWNSSDMEAIVLTHSVCSSSICIVVLECFIFLVDSLWINCNVSYISFYVLFLFMSRLWLFYKVISRMLLCIVYLFLILLVLSLLLYVLLSYVYFVEVSQWLLLLFNLALTYVVTRVRYYYYLFLCSYYYCGCCFRKNYFQTTKQSGMEWCNLCWEYCRVPRASDGRLSRYPSGFPGSHSRHGSIISPSALT
jgi:hypothetical protein